jgi:hypothetical protein
MGGMGVWRAGEQLALPVRHNGIDLGYPVDVLFDVAAGRAIGLEVHCRDETVRFVPLGAARVGTEATELASPLALLDDVAFYRSRGRGLRELRGETVARAGRPVGALTDVLLEDSGAIDSLLVETAAGRRRMTFGPGVSLGERNVSAA